MAGKMSKTKGANAEREAAELVMEWVGPVYDFAGRPRPVLKRNLEQTRSGGHDIVGIDWLALEIKRQEKIQLNAWWSQTTRQAATNQIPVLMWRVNRAPWAFRLIVTGYHCGQIRPYPVDMALETFRDWLQTECWARLQN